MGILHMCIHIFFVYTSVYYIKRTFKESVFWTFLVVQWIVVCLLMQGTGVQCLVWEASTRLRATKPMHHNYGGCVQQLLKPKSLVPVLHNKRSHRSEKLVHHIEE